MDYLGYIVSAIVGGAVVYVIGKAIELVQGIEEQFGHPEGEDFQ